MTLRFGRSVLILLCLSLAHAGSAATVLMHTPLGTIEVELFDDVAPQTVANFLRYVNDGDYANTFIHRSVPGFIVQGGGFFFDGDSVEPVVVRDPVINEPRLSNVRGTIAMAKPGDNPNGATNQWFFNLADNSSNLDQQNGGFTVFGRVLGDGMRVLDLIASVQRFGDWPLIAYPGVGEVEQQHLVSIGVNQVADGFRINPGLSGTWFNANTGGQGWLIDVYESNGQLQVFLAWFTYDTSEPGGDEPSPFGTKQHRWFTASGSVNGDSAELDVFLNTGGQFNHPRQTQLSQVGTISLSFSDCTHARMVFQFDGNDGPVDEIDIERLTPNTACVQSQTP